MGVIQWDFVFGFWPKKELFWKLRHLDYEIEVMREGQYVGNLIIIVPTTKLVPYAVFR